jgi:hypothetical protein
MRRVNRHERERDVGRYGTGVACRNAAFGDRLDAERRRLERLARPLAVDVAVREGVL